MKTKFLSIVTLILVGQLCFSQAKSSELTAIVTPLLSNNVLQKGAIVGIEYKYAFHKNLYSVFGFSYRYGDADKKVVFESMPSYPFRLVGSYESRQVFIGLGTQFSFLKKHRVFGQLTTGVASREETLYNRAVKRHPNYENLNINIKALGMNYEASIGYDYEVIPQTRIGVAYMYSDYMSELNLINIRLSYQFL